MSFAAVNNKMRRIISTIKTSLKITHLYFPWIAINGGSCSRQRKAALFEPRQSPAATFPSEQGNLHMPGSGGLCRRLNNCIVMGCKTSKNQPHHQYHHQQQEVSKLVQQVADLEKEVQNQKEHRLMYRKRTERTQEYLRYCLQIAQENGFLHLMVSEKDDEQKELPSSDIINTSPPALTPTEQNSALAAIIDQAKQNGWHIDPQEIELQDKLGHGTTADIYRGTWRGLDVAVKCMYADFFESNENGESFFAQEVDTLSRQRHPFVLHLVGACLVPPTHGWIVTELLSTTLKDWLHGPGKRSKERMVPLPPLEDRLARALEIAQAMQYLHKQKPKVIHRDLKSSNIFLDDRGHVRVADFGHARFLRDKEMALTGETGTLIYMAPEIIRYEPYDEKCDVYSFGVILNEIITGEYPYIETDYSPMQIAMEVGEGHLRPKLPEDDGQLGELVGLICLSWDKDANNRPYFATITCTLRKIRKDIVGSV